jgi:two-component system chemotaxis response regulator CheB
MNALRARAAPADLVIAIGSSTGGPEAVVAVLSRMPKESPPIVLVQHMPEHFTAKFAQRLDSILAVRVKEAVDGDVVLPGLVLIAPGTTHHMTLRREAQGLVVRLDTTAPIMHHRPSVDNLFHSCARVLGRSAVGVILTGMGSDGARGMLAMRQAGAQTIAQDEKTSLVYGMPMEAAALGAASYVLPLNEIGVAALRLAQGGRKVTAA